MTSILFKTFQEWLTIMYVVVRQSCSNSGFCCIVTLSNLQFSTGWVKVGNLGKLKFWDIRETRIYKGFFSFEKCQIPNYIAINTKWYIWRPTWASPKCILRQVILVNFLGELEKTQPVFPKEFTRWWVSKCKEEFRFSYWYIYIGASKHELRWVVNTLCSY